MRPKPPSPSPVSLADAAADAGRFFAREHRLIVPIALAFFLLPALVFELLLPGIQMATADVAQTDPRVLWMLPVALIGIVGGTAITALRLNPGISVGESIGLAVRRLPALIGASLLAAAAATAMLLVLLIAASFFGLLAGVQTDALTRLGSAVSLVLLLAIFTRMLPLVPAAVAEGQGPVAALKRTVAIGRGHFWRLLSGFVLILVAVPLATLAARATLGSVGRLLDLATGAPGVFTAVAAVAINAIGAGISAYLYLVVAALYRRLAR